MLINYKPSWSCVNVNVLPLIRRLVAPLQQTTLGGAQRAEETRKTPWSLWKPHWGSWLVFAFVCFTWKMQFCQSQILSFACWTQIKMALMALQTQWQCSFLHSLPVTDSMKNKAFISHKKISFIFFPTVYDTGTTRANVVTLKSGWSAAIVVLESLELWPYRAWILLFLKCES